jgi:hypothetical protein
LRSAIDEHLGWETPELEDEADYVANVERCGRDLLQYTDDRRDLIGQLGRAEAALESERSARTEAERERDEARARVAAVESVLARVAAAADDDAVTADDLANIGMSALHEIRAATASPPEPSLQGGQGETR